DSYGHDAEPAGGCASLPHNDRSVPGTGDRGTQVVECRSDPCSLHRGKSEGVGLAEEGIQPIWYGFRVTAHARTSGSAPRRAWRAFRSRLHARERSGAGPPHADVRDGSPAGRLETDCRLTSRSVIPSPDRRSTGDPNVRWMTGGFVGTPSAARWPLTGSGYTRRFRSR